MVTGVIVQMAIDIDIIIVLVTIVNNSINCKGLDSYINHIIGVIGDEEADEDK